MIFRPFNAATLAELAAIQAEIDALSGSRSPAVRKLNDQTIRELENDRDAIHQADYDLSQQHRG